MLRAEGIQSYPVLIDSSRKLDADVPSPAQFDHVITAARLGTGTGLTWLDTTPEVTPFGLILYQLRNKQAVRGVGRQRGRLAADARGFAGQDLHALHARRQVQRVRRARCDA